MSAYVFAPRDPLVLRDGRLAGDGVPMRTLRFPWPSSVAGLVRTRIGQDGNGAFRLSRDEARRLLEVPVAGPWLAELDAGDQVIQAFFPAPADCLWHDEGGGGNLRRRRLAPMSHPAGCWSDLPEGLELVGPVGAAPSVKAAAGPAFFSWDAMQSWLSEPQDEVQWKPELGLDVLLVELRIHVAIDPATGVAKDGMLFSTEGLCFTVGDGKEARRFGIVFACDDQRFAEKNGPAHLGGERRIGFVRQADEKAQPGCVTVPEDARRLRLVLVTPGLFKQGFRPSDEVFNGQARVVAAAVGRPQSISGWDYAVNKPKASRRMAPAGSVYWIDLAEGVRAREFAERWWMRSVCDEEQDQRDGFGLCLVGVGR